MPNPNSTVPLTEEQKKIVKELMSYFKPNKPIERVRLPWKGFSGQLPDNAMGKTVPCEYCGEYKPTLHCAIDVNGEVEDGMICDQCYKNA